MSFLEIFFSVLFWSTIIVLYFKTVIWVSMDFEPETLKGKLLKLLMIAILISIPVSIVVYIAYSETVVNTAIY